jgi:FMN reductase
VNGNGYRGGPVPATLVVGNPRAGSRTLGIAGQAAKVICAGLRDSGVDMAEPDLVDLAELGPRLPMRATAGAADPDLTRALDLVRRPGLLIVASPTFKGAYTGLLKMFLDLLPRDGIGTRTVAVALMTAGWEQHRHVVDAYLRTLLVELGATVPAPGLAVLESEFADLSTVVGSWASRSIPILAAVLDSASGTATTARNGGMPGGGRTSNDSPDPVMEASSR